MAEAITLVCDVCGKPAEETVSIKIGGRNLAKDLCGTHLRELAAGTHPPKRGRKPGSKTTAKRRGRPKGSTRKRTAAKATRRKSTNGRRKRSTRKTSTNGRRKASNGRRKSVRRRSAAGKDGSSKS